MAWPGLWNRRLVGTRR